MYIAHETFILFTVSTCMARYGKALTTSPVVMRSSPATGHICCALLVKQPKYVESTFVAVSLFM